VNVYFMKKHPHVSFAGGWKDFAESHNIREGDRVKFELVERCGFSVSHAPPDHDVVEISSSDDE